MKFLVTSFFAFSYLILHAQVPTPKPTIGSAADATVASTPDQAAVDFSVETRALTAQAAAEQNASQTSAVLGALQALLGANANIQTRGYSLSPIYNNPSNGSAPTLTGYSVTNTIEVTITNLAQVGRVLDTGTQAGATRVQSLVFGLKDPDPVRLQALRLATQRARSHADAMAGGAGVHLGAILQIREGTSSPIYSGDTIGALAPTTPIQPGTVSVTATVSMVFEIVP